MQGKLPSRKKNGKNSRLLFALLFASSLFTLRCATEIADIEVCPLEDPFTGEGYCVNVVSKRERVIPRDLWVKERRNYIMMSPESYAKIKNKHYKDCYSTECKHVLESVEKLFDVIDKAVKTAGEKK